MRVIPLWCVMVLLLASCGGMGDSGVRRADVELTQTISAASFLTGTITANYPKDWVARAAGGEITFANNQQALDAVDSPDQGQIAGTLLAFPDELMLSMLSVETDTAPDRVLRQFIGGLTASVTERTTDFGSPEAFASSDRPAALATGRITQDGYTVNAVAAAVQERGGYVMVLLVAAGGDSASHRALVRAIADTIDYIPPES